MKTTTRNSEAGVITCSKCGQQNPENNFKCFQCGKLLPDTPRSGDKNDMATMSYKLALFALIPGVGFFLGIPAIVLGDIGLRFAKKHPERAGRIRAYTGIILGFLSMIVSVFVVIWGAVLSE